MLKRTARAITAAILARFRMTGKEFVVYLNQRYPSFDTPAGTVSLKHEVDVNDGPLSVISPEICIYTSWEPLELPYDVAYGLQYTEAQKKGIIKAFQATQEQICKDAIKLLGKRRIEGFYIYWHYHAKPVWDCTRFLTWRNFTIVGDWQKPEKAKAKIGGFKWDFFIDDYDFTQFMQPKP